MSEVSKIAKVSRATVVHASKDLAREARRKSKTAAKTDAKTDRRERAQQFLKDTLAQGPKQVQAVEAAAAKAHVDLVTLEQARADLGVTATRANTGVHAVQWSLPG